eukprot:GSMAST32.ASY1.ANO1.133.1 assembled CDS
MTASPDIANNTDATPPAFDVVKKDKTVTIHPLVLLSTVDHYNRVAKDTRNRRVIDVTNSFAVPFEEDKRDGNIWFLDHNYLDEMAGMFRRINAKELVVGFYSTGPHIRPADLEIADIFGKRHCKNPIFTIIDVRAERGDEGIPVKAYKLEEEVQVNGKASRRIFKHLPSRIEAHETEEVGVEHLLQLQVNNQIVYNIQNILNLIPNLCREKILRALFVKTNDTHLVIYIAALLRSITALHDSVNNKLKYGVNPYDDGNDETKKNKLKKKDTKDGKKDEGEEKPGVDAKKDTKKN